MSTIPAINNNAPASDRPRGFGRIGLFRAGNGTLDYWEGEPEAGSE